MGQSVETETQGCALAAQCRGLSLGTLRCPPAVAMPRLGRRMTYWQPLEFWLPAEVSSGIGAVFVVK